MCDQSRGSCPLPRAACTWEGMEDREPGACGRQGWQSGGVWALRAEPGSSKYGLACMRLRAVERSLGEARDPGLSSGGWHPSLET